MFENEVTFAQRIKANFLSNLWTWENLYSVDNTNSLLDFLFLLQLFAGCFFVCFHMVPSCIRPVYCLEPLGSFLINILLFTNQKRKKNHQNAYKNSWAQKGAFCS